MGGAEGGDKPPGNEKAEDQCGGEKMPGSMEPLELGPPWTSTPPKQETGGATFPQAAADKGTGGPPTNKPMWGPPTKETDDATLPRAATDKETPSKEETGGATFPRAAANKGTGEPPTDELTWRPPTKETGGATLPWAAPDKETRGSPIDEPTWGVGKRYAAMNIVPMNLVSVGDGAHKPAMSSKPNKRR
jgi:hypothetical protein